MKSYFPNYEAILEYKKVCQEISLTKAALLDAKWLRRGCRSRAWSLQNRLDHLRYNAKERNPGHREPNSWGVEDFVQKVRTAVERVGY